MLLPRYTVADLIAMTYGRCNYHNCVADGKSTLWMMFYVVSKVTDVIAIIICGGW